ncbi:MAG: MIP/aquaporin family protein [Pseudomonadales bacterium]
MSRPLAAEALGTFFLLACVVGSGIMAERLAGGNVGIALLGNTIATGAMLYVLITFLGPISGAHFNPAVTLAMVLERRITRQTAIFYVGVQVVAAVAGTWAAHTMFAEDVIQFSEKLRTGPDQWFSESLATFGLVITIFGCVRYKADAVPAAVGLYITSAYWFTASTSFANPAVTIARSLTNTFSGIAPAHVLGFISAQLVGAIIAVWVHRMLIKDR